jgi:multiple sugar transport system ATP-binding protein/alpha-glucoside transport system ATP-binding protein
LSAEAGRLSNGKRVGVGIRPENTRFAEDERTDLVFNGTIDLVEHLGGVQILYLDLPGTSRKFLIEVYGATAFARAGRFRLCSAKRYLSF